MENKGLVTAKVNWRQPRVLTHSFKRSSVISLLRRQNRYAAARLLSPANRFQE
jgi:hypothetical protein